MTAPPYFDFLIPAFRAGAAGPDVHLGLWGDLPLPTGPITSEEFAAAQARLTERAIEAGAITGARDMLDIGCGFGGLLARLADRCDADLVGVGNDPRQLDICRRLSPRVTIVEADACELPFADSSFDRVFCLEAMFHFRARSAFLAEAARILKRGGHLVVTDILFSRSGEGLDTDRFAAILRADYGPWPEPWIDVAELIAMAESNGLAVEQFQDLTAAVLPSYRVIAPQAWTGSFETATAGALMRWMHETGAMTYPLLQFRRF